MREISTHLCIRNAREEQTPTKMDWNLGSSVELPVSPARQYTGNYDHPSLARSEVRGPTLQSYAGEPALTGRLSLEPSFEVVINGKRISTTNPFPSLLYACTFPPWKR